jgi:MFS family permease
LVGTVAEPESGTASASAAPAAGLLSRRYRALTLGMVVLIALTAFEYLAVATAMPSVAEALHGVSLYALSFGGTLASSVVGIVVAGRCSDKHGPVTALWSGVVLFVIGLLIAGLAPDMSWLICGRIVQGFGSGAIAVALYVVVAWAFPPELQPRIFGAFATAWIVPSLIGPTLSGLIVEYVGWRWVFLVVPLLALPTALMLRAGLRAVPLRDRIETSARSEGEQSISWALATAIAACVLHVGSQSLGVVGIASGAAALAALIISMRRLMPQGTLRAARGLPCVIALRAIGNAAFFGTEVFIPLLLSREYGLSPVWAGGVLTIGALGWSAASWYQGNSRSSWTRVRILQTGMGLMSLGIAVLGVVTALLAWHSTTWATVAIIVGALVAWLLTGAGMGLTYPTLSVLTLSLSPPHQQGRNSSALQLADALGIVIVLAFEGWLFALLLPRVPTAAYLLTFAMSSALALLGLALSSRTSRDQYST